MAEILVVDDERVLRSGIRSLLSGEGFAVRTARDGDEALKKIAEKRPDLVLLDVMMPKMNGFRCCERIRETDRILPVIFLTAKDAEADQVRGIGFGADDFVSKSASDAVLLARINRALERSSGFGGASGRVSGTTIALGDVSVDMRSFVVMEKGREISRLTRTEADILKLFDSRRGEPVLSDDIITELRGKGFACEDTMLYMHISNLRKKLGAAADFIVTRHGFGYGLAE
jgi:DNA-binding response OmpR family regulator